MHFHKCIKLPLSHSRWVCGLHKLTEHTLSYVPYFWWWLKMNDGKKFENMFKNNFGNFFRDDCCNSNVDFDNKHCKERKHNCRCKESERKETTNNKI